MNKSSDKQYVTEEQKKFAEEIANECYVISPLAGAITSSFNISRCAELLAEREAYLAERGIIEARLAEVKLLQADSMWTTKHKEDRLADLQRQLSGVEKQLAEPKDKLK